jgi:hypothetical protein
MDNKTPVKKEEVRQEVPKTKVVTAEKAEPKKSTKPTTVPKPEAEKPLTLSSSLFSLDCSSFSYFSPSFLCLSNCLILHFQSSKY